MFKKAKVVMLPTNKEASKGDIISNGRNLFLYGERFYNPYSGCYKLQNLYIISDDEIKEGDWVLINFKTLHKVEDFISKSMNKIIATNNESLRRDCTCSGMRDKVVCNWMCKTHQDYILPQPSQAFIEKYVSEYNKGNVITDVLVEYVKINTDYRTVNYPKPEIKINTKDNTITIKKVKESWSREEVIELLNRVDSLARFEDYNLKEWIEENL